MQSYQIKKNDAGQRLDKFLRKYLPEAGNSILYKMLRKKNITVNGKKAEGNEMLAVGDTVCFFFSEETFAKWKGTLSTIQIKLDAYAEAYRNLKGIGVVYEDEDILILNKPAGILTQKAKEEDLSLNEWMIGYLLAKNRLTESELSSFKPSVQNRLDCNTSGLVLCGISLSGSQLLSRLLKERTLKKYYMTIVKGRVSKAGMAAALLQKDENTNRVRIGEEGSKIQTAYRPIAFSENGTFLEVELLTGKSHQIRAHMASLGHPLLGDPKYGDAAFNALAPHKLRHQLLHAVRVEFPPLSKPYERLSGKVFKAPYPVLFKEVLQEWQLGIPED